MIDKRWGVIEKELRGEILDLMCGYFTGATFEGLVDEEEGCLINQLLSIFKSKFSLLEETITAEDLDYILVDLYTIRASIPMTQGKVAREMMRELISKIETLKKKLRGEIR